VIFSLRLQIKSSFLHNKIKLQKLLFQLRVLTGLRNLQSILNKKLNTMPLTFEFDVTKDFFYQQGEEKGEEKGIEKGIEKMLLNTDFSVEKITDILEIPDEIVLTVKNRLVAENRLISKN
jgi:hypothetical protein